MSKVRDKALARLQRRVKGYQDAIAGNRVPWPGGYRMPGSMNKKKTAPKGRR